MSEMSMQETTTDSTLPVSIRVVEALADAEGVAPDELRPLSDSMDLEALDAVVDSCDDALSISLSVNGYRVTVDETGSVHVS